LWVERGVIGGAFDDGTSSKVSQLWKIIFLLRGTSLTEKHQAEKIEQLAVEGKKKEKGRKKWYQGQVGKYVLQEKGIFRVSTYL